MTFSVVNLLDIVRTYYPRGIPADHPNYSKSVEQRRLVAARRKAGAENEQWRALLKVVGDQFPAVSVHNDSLHLPMGSMDAAYSGKLFQRDSANGPTMGFLVSFLVPYYVVYSARIVEESEKEPPTEAVSFRITIPWDEEADAPGAAEIEDWQPPKPTRRIVSFENFSTDEQSYLTWIARKIETTWGYERMPPEVGKVLVPDVATNRRGLGEATLYDCLLSESL